MISGIVTGMLLVLFVVGCAWAFSPRRRTAFDEAARLPLREDRAAPETVRTDAAREDAGSEDAGPEVAGPEVAGHEQGDVR